MTQDPTNANRKQINEYREPVGRADFVPFQCEEEWFSCFGKLV
jgi:hypothetical protein